MRSYQLTYLISPEANKDEAAVQVNSLISGEGGFLLSQQFPQERELGYAVGKKKRAFLSGAEFQLLPEKIASLQEKLKAQPNLLRYLIVNKKAVMVKPRSVRRIVPRAPQIPEKSERQKVELEEIEKKLEEILDEPK